MGNDGDFTTILRIKSTENGSMKFASYFAALFSSSPSASFFLKASAWSFPSFFRCAVSSLLVTKRCLLTYAQERPTSAAPNTTGNLQADMFKKSRDQATLHNNTNNMQMNLKSLRGTHKQSDTLVIQKHTVIVLCVIFIGLAL